MASGLIPGKRWSASLVWKIEFQAAAIKQLKKMERNESDRVKDFLHSRVKTLDNPRQLGIALEGSQFKHLWRYRVGDYRIICDIQDHRLVVLVIEIGHRREITAETNEITSSVLRSSSLCFRLGSD